MREQNDPRSGATGEGALQFLFEQNQNRFVEIFNGKTAGWRGKDGVITGDGTENPFRFTQRVQHAGNQLCGTWACVDHHNGIVVVDIQNQILGRALLESVLFYDGRCIFSSVSIEEMNFYGVTGKELGGIIEQLRLTDGVEVAIFLYETDKDEYKVSLRSKKMIDVARIATAFGGGGHVRAAGFSAKGNVHSIVNKIGEMIEQQYNEDNA